MTTCLMIAICALIAAAAAGCGVLFAQARMNIISQRLDAQMRALTCLHERQRAIRHPEGTDHDVSP